MLALKNFFRLGVRWVGPGADVLRSRHARVVLEHLAHKVDRVRPHSGVRLTPADLSDDLYGPRQSRRALAALTAAGVIARDRSRTHKGLREDVASTFVHVDLIQAARTWNRERTAKHKQGLRGNAINPAQVEISLPLAWPVETRENRKQVPPNCAPPSENPHGIRAGEVAACHPVTTLHDKKSETGCPQPPHGGEGMDMAPAVPESGLPGDHHQPAEAGARGGQWIFPRRQYPKHDPSISAAGGNDGGIPVPGRESGCSRKV